MRVVKNERPIPCDIDGTLIIHTPNSNLDHDRLCIIDPYSGDECWVIPNANMVRLFKEELARGSHMLVWSRGGYQWAAAVIKALNLDFENVTVMSKPFVYFDDLDVKEWMDQRVFLPHTSYFKK